MFRKWMCVLIMSFSCLTQAKKNGELYQIDLLIFSQQISPSTKELTNTLLSPPLESGILLGTDKAGTAPYHLLPSHASQLQQAYWALSHQPQYQVLLHYSWLQPFNNKRAIILPKASHNDWQIEGTLRIKQANYYLFNAELLFSSLKDASSSFILTQKHRLQEEKIYYFDHPQVGMLIKIHQYL